MTIVTVSSREERLFRHDEEKLWRVFLNTGRLMPCLQDLHQAIRLKDTRRVRALISCRSVKINSSLRSCTALSLAVYQGDREIVQILLDNGAEVDRLSRDWNHRIETPLFTACRLGMVEIARALVSHAADVNATDFYNHSPLWIATRERSCALVKLLLLNGADLSIADKWSQCPLYLACKFYGRAPIAKILVQHGSRLDMTDLEGRGPLYWAMVNGSEDLVKLLVRAGVYVSSRERELISGRNPVDLVEENPHLTHWLRRKVSTPPKLGTIAIQNVRRQLSVASKRRSIWDRIETLPVPRTLKASLRLDDY